MARETGWLVEDAHGSGRPRYRYFDEVGLVGWTEDPNKAIRFARRVDAESFSAADEDAWHVTEHSWDDGAAPEPGTARFKVGDPVVISHWGATSKVAGILYVLENGETVEDAQCSAQPPRDGQ